MTALVYRTAGAWGAGKGSLLSSAEVDTNFYNLDQGKLDKANVGKVQGVDSPNLLQNGTGEFGDTFWNSANFGWTKDLVAGSGTLFSLASALTTGTTLEDVSDFIPIGPAVLLSLQGEIFTGPMTAGNALIAFDCYDSSKTLIASSEFTTNNLQFGNGWQFCTGNGITPSNTAYVKVHKRAYNNPRAPSGGVKFRRIKLEANNSTTAQYSIYSQEQSLYEITSRMAALGECRFESVSTTQCRLNRYKGRRLTINGRNEDIPAAGVSLAPTGTTANTLYYVYAYMSGGVMTLEASTTVYTQDANTGIAVKTGDATRTLVGMTYVITAGAWVDPAASVNALSTLSYFNRRRQTAYSYITTSSVITSTSTNLVEATTNLRTYFLKWAEEDLQGLGNGGVAWNQSTAMRIAISVDYPGINPGAANLMDSGAINFGGPNTNNDTYPACVQGSKSGLAEGWHFTTIVVDIGGASNTVQLTTNVNDPSYRWSNRIYTMG